MPMLLANNLTRLLLSLMLASMSSLAIAVIEPRQFDSDVDAARYQQFIDELRCPKCQNQNLSASDAPIAKDLRRELQRLIKEGASDQQITQFMVDRYGEFVLYRPPLQWQTGALWFGPILMCLIAFIVWWRSGTFGAAQHSEQTSPSEAEKARLKAWLESDSDR